MDNFEKSIYDILTRAIFENEGKDLASNDTLCIQTPKHNLMLVAGKDGSTPLLYLGDDNIIEVDEFPEQPTEDDIDIWGFLWYINYDLEMTKCFWQEDNEIQQGIFHSMPFIVEREVEGLNA